MKIFALLCLFVAKTLSLKCACQRDPSCENSNFCEIQDGGACFKSIFKKNEGKIVETLRCLQPEQLLPPGRPFICEYSRKNGHKYVSECCDEADFCNSNLVLKLAQLQTEENATENLSGIQVLFVSVFSGVVLVLISVLGLIYIRRKRSFVTKNNCKHNDSVADNLLIKNQDYHQVDLGVTPVTGSELHDYLTSTNSGSGSGLPLLVQRSVARQVTLLHTIGQGRFGQVWKGDWRGEFVAVKIFSTIDEKSWFREVEIFQTVMLRHENILGFIAADNKDSGTWTQLWLITEYMENGSLFDFLSNMLVTHDLLLRMANSIATGLAHLHMEIVGTQGKPAIAHRDLKSKNILVKKTGVCAIGDLGMAVKYDPTSGEIDIPQTGKVGTKRYLAPEILNDTMDMSSFESFKQNDVYALGLVLWEICQRSIPNGRQKPLDLEFRLPYSEYVASDPSIEEMRKVVCIEKSRPEIPPEWLQDTVLAELTSKMQECWYENGASRLTALRVKKSLTAIIDSQNAIITDKL